MQVCCVCVVPNYLNCATLSKDLSHIFQLQFCHEFRSRNMNIYPVFSVFTSRPTFFPVNNKGSKLMCFSSQYVWLVQQINITATCQKLICPVHSQSLLVCLDLRNGTFEQLEKDGDTAFFNFRPFLNGKCINICLSVLYYKFHLKTLLCSSLVS